MGQRAGWLADHSYQSADLALARYPGDRSWAPFGGVDAADVRVDTGSGSSLTIQGNNALIGIAGKQQSEKGSLLVGGFFESVDADYKSKDHYDGIGTLRGKGKISATGLGVMGRGQWHNGTRVEVSLRGGRMKTRFHSKDYVDVDNIAAAYSFHSPYYSAHLGVGHTWQINTKNSFDLLARLFWNRQESKEVTLSTGEKVRFADDESQRARLGARFTHAWTERRSGYIGAAVEREFAGDVEGRNQYGHELKSLSLEGTTGVFELGVIIRSRPDKPFAMEIGVQGYTGALTGISGGIRLGWEF
jgi:outer membrane autotransporter protein